MFDKGRQQVIEILEQRGILRELCPVANGCGGTAYWHWEVLKPELLPEGIEWLRAQLILYGEIRN